VSKKDQKSCEGLSESQKGSKEKVIWGVFGLIGKGKRREILKKGNR